MQLFKFIADGIKLFPSEIEWALPFYKGAAIGTDTLPYLLGVEFIIGPNISALILAGAILGWFILFSLVKWLGQFAPEVIYRLFLNSLVLDIVK